MQIIVISRCIIIIVRNCTFYSWLRDALENVTMDGVLAIALTINYAASGGHNKTFLHFPATLQFHGQCFQLSTIVITMGRIKENQTGDNDHAVAWPI